MNNQTLPAVPDKTDCQHVSPRQGLSPSDLLMEHCCLGFRVNPGTIDDYIMAADRAISQSVPLTVFYHNLHSLYMYFKSQNLRQSYDKSQVLVDGMPVIWLLRLFRHDVTNAQRITYVDLIWPLLEQARERNWRVYYLGQSQEVQSAALSVIRDRLPGIDIDGHHGYFDMEDAKTNSEIIDGINAFRSDLVLVGFGAPRQELWVDTYRNRIEANVLFTCGACMEYVAGAVKTPPRWLGRVGLEWSFRLLENPRRFAFRYLIEPIYLGFILLGNLISNGRS